jgi:hypothetical protein
VSECGHPGKCGWDFAQNLRNLLSCKLCGLSIDNSMPILDASSQMSLAE